MFTKYMDIPSFVSKPLPNNLFIDCESNNTECDATQIYNYATQLAVHFKNGLTIPERSNVVLIFESGIVNLIAFIGCQMANLVPTVLCPNDILKTKEIIKECSPKYAFISNKINDLLVNKVDNLFALPNVDERFDTCINLINDYKAIIKMDVSDTLKLYSCYKQAMQGDINMPRPGLLQPKQRMKWNAWNDLKDTSKNEAKIRYCTMVQKLLNKQTLLKGVLSVPQHVVDITRLNPDICRKLPIMKKKDHETCFIQYSSGSTSNPKGVIITHASIHHNLTEIINILEDNKYFDNPMLICWLPHYHDMGFIGGYLICYFLSLRISEQTVYCMTPHYFLQNIQSIYTNLFPKVCCISMPNFAMNYLHDNINIDQSLDLSNINLVWCGSEKINRKVQVQFVDKLRINNFKATSIINCYGLAENTLIVSHGSYSDEIVNDTVSVGKPIDGTSYLIIDENTMTPCAENKTGMIYLCGLSCTAGYLNPALNQQSFTNIDGSIYYRTGDLGFTSNTLLYIQGRDCEKLIINGKNIYPEDVEQSLIHIKNILPQNIVAFGIYDGVTERVVLVIEGDESLHPDFNIIRINLLRTFGFNVHNIIFAPSGTIPRTSSSKKMRNKIKNMYLNKDFAILDQYEYLSDNTDNSHLCQEIIEDFSIFTEIDYEKWKNSTLIELGIDSMTYSTYAQKIEAKNTKNVCFDISVCYGNTLKEFYELLLFVYDKTTVVNPVCLKEKGVYLSDDLRQIMINDSQINEDEIPKYQTVGIKMANSPKTILLTGATGFLGVYLLYELLLNTQATIICLVRSTDDAHALQRVKNKIEEQHISITESILEQRCTFIKGDIGQPFLGLGKKEYDYWSKNVDVVFHSAAEINYVASYKSLKNANVDGTKNTIHFCFANQKKELHFIGSTMIFGWTTEKNLLETNNNQQCKDIAIGYGQSKWVSEQLIFNAIKLGLIAKIYRSSFITASIATKQYSSSDIVSILFEYSIKRKISINERLLFDAISVDCCSKNIITLSKIDNYYNKTFHLSQSEGQPIQDFYKIIKARVGITMKEMNLLDFVDYINKNSTCTDAVYPLIPFLSDNKHGILRMVDKVYSNTFTKNCFSENSLPYAYFTISDNMNSVINFLTSKHLI